MNDNIEQTDKAQKGKGKLFVQFTAFLYIGLGLLFMLNPAGMASGLGFENLNKNALTDIMATYGGLELGLGIFILITLKENGLKLALKIIFFTFAGFALGRALAAIRFQGFYGDHCFWLAFELIYLLITKHFLRKNKQQEAPK
jgi:hypothetical protein